VPDLVLGTAQLRGTYGAIGRPSTRRTDGEAESFLARAIELGFTAIDTAPAYDDAEEIIGRAAPPSVPVHTKVAANIDPVTSVARSLARLQRNHVEVLYFHDSRIAGHDPEHLIDDAAALVGEQIGSLGISVYESSELAATIDDGRFRVVQLPMSILDRRIDDALLKRAHDSDIVIMVRSVFLQGTILTAADDLPPQVRALAPYIDAVRGLAREVELSVPALAMAWVKQRPGVAGVVVGAQSVAELEELASAWDALPLDEAVVNACETLPRTPDQLCDPRLWAT
jgi:aryl-alcohol dehydrogenase-like predicted oxidoreductase